MPSLQVKEFGGDRNLRDVLPEIRDENYVAVECLVMTAWRINQDGKEFTALLQASCLSSENTNSADADLVALCSPQGWRPPTWHALDAPCLQEYNMAWVPMAVSSDSEHHVPGSPTASHSCPPEKHAMALEGQIRDALAIAGAQASAGHNTLYMHSPFPWSCHKVPLVMGTAALFTQ